MIIMRGKFDLVPLIHTMLDEFAIRGEDVLDHHNWEISEKWLAANDSLVDDEVYEIVNHWRSQRGEPALTRPREKSSEA